MSDWRPNGMQPMQHLSMVDRATLQIRHAILAGLLEPGKPFTVGEVAERLQVSRIPVREALQRLEKDGLVQLRAGRSAVVSPVDADEVRAVFHLRRLIEPDVGGRSAPRHTEEDLVRLQKSLDAFSGDDPEAMLAEHHAFHVMLLRPAATVWDFRLLEQLWWTSERYVRLVLSDRLLDPKQKQELAKAHAPLLDAARLRSSAAVKQEIRRHLEFSESNIVSEVAEIAER